MTSSEACMIYKRAVRILLECILVAYSWRYSMLSLNRLSLGMFECEDGRSRSRSTLTADVVISNADNVSVEKTSLRRFCK